ncbi:STM3941 family protein [Hymenobacter metallicola]|uniref:Uncharacterized protein n=1 Tax=Hymenobacter metallicola TaxID=2563114 RepID=A0A4Z0PUY9_9BACT|nr:STM3941 family protein [Hymenobacter metallicola]TGE21109.1 hypothetical protein E5K02_24155 [Hymenobacter metallicola]
MEVKLYKSPWRAILLMLGCSVFVAAGIWMLNQDTAPSWVAWMSILFFGLGYPVGLFNLLDRRPQIIINTVGIFDRMSHHEFINWEIIEGAYLVEVHHQKFICLLVAPDFEPSRKKGAVHKSLIGISKAMGFQELNISLGLIQIDEFRFTEFIMAMSKADSGNRRKLLDQFSC